MASKCSNVHTILDTKECETPYTTAYKQYIDLMTTYCLYGTNTINNDTCINFTTNNDFIEGTPVRAKLMDKSAASCAMNSDTKLSDSCLHIFKVKDKIVVANEIAIEKQAKEDAEKAKQIQIAAELAQAEAILAEKKLTDEFNAKVKKDAEDAANLKLEIIGIGIIFFIIFVFIMYKKFTAPKKSKSKKTRKYQRMRDDIDNKDAENTENIADNENSSES